MKQRIESRAMAQAINVLHQIDIVGQMNVCSYTLSSSPIHCQCFPARGWSISHAQRMTRSYSLRISSAGHLGDI